jgi:hypothetical protein
MKIPFAFFFLAFASGSWADVAVNIDTVGTTFAYTVKSGESGELKFWVPSSYQPDGKNRKFATEMTQGVEFLWNPDRTSVAIIEANHRMQGEVIILTPLNDHINYHNALTIELVSSILKQTGLRVDKHRFFVDRWESNSVIALRLSVRYRDESKDGEFLPGLFSAVLDLKQGTLVRFERVSDESPLVPSAPCPEPKGQ